MYKAGKLIFAKHLFIRAFVLNIIECFVINMFNKSICYKKYHKMNINSLFRLIDK